MSLNTFSEYVEPPKRLDHPLRMQRFLVALKSCGFDLAGCAKRLDVFPRLGVNFWQAFRSETPVDLGHPVDTLIALFIDGRRICIDQLRVHVPSTFIDDAAEMRLLELDGRKVQSKLCLFPCYGLYVATDRADKNTAINQVMWLWPESYLLGGLVKRGRRRRGFDMGTGSGVHALLAGRHCDEVVGADINSRAIEFSRFNAALNNTTNVDFVLSDLFDSIESTCDLLTANPPYAPDSAARAGDNFWSGGVQGTELLRRIVEAIPSRVDLDGVVHINALFPNPPGTTIKVHFDQWLGGAIGQYEVIDHTWPVPRYEDLLSEKPFEGDKSAWRFGVVSLRRAPSGAGWWREVAGRGLFFGPEGNCLMTADFDPDSDHVGTTSPMRSGSATKAVIEKFGS